MGVPDVLVVVLPGNYQYRQPLDRCGQVGGVSSQVGPQVLASFQHLWSIQHDR